MKAFFIFLVLVLASVGPTWADTSEDDAAPNLPSLEAATGPDEQILDVKVLSKIPVAVYRSRPTYPLNLRKAGVTGKVVIGFVITKEGRVVNLHVVSATNLEFALSAMECLSQWRFKPGERNGVPVNCRVTMPMSYDIK
ncbi:MAG TPA: energy transducer TonB [Opitutaceae bacterium]